MKVLFLYNPHSGKKQGEVSVRRVREMFRQAGYSVTVHAIDFRRNPFDETSDLDLVVIAGGDGTVNYVVNRMMELGLNLRLGIIPSGTANDFARALGMSTDPIRAARQILDGHKDGEERIDCGRVNGQYFVNIFSFGIFTTTSQRTSDELKQRIGKLAYLIEGVREFRAMHGIPLQIQADGESFDFHSLMALIFNGATAGGFPLAPRSSLKDGLFDCILLEKQRGWHGRWRSICGMILHILGRKAREVHHFRASTIDITSPLNEPTDVDGQKGADFPLHIECLAGALRVICP